MTYIACFLLFFFFQTSTHHLLAISPSPTPTTTSSVSPTPTDSITSDIQKIRDAVSQKVKEKLLQIINPSSGKKGIIGKVIQIDEHGIFIDYRGSSRQISLADDLTIIDNNRNKSSLSKLKVGQDILVLGNQDGSTNTFTAKRIIFANQTDSQIKKTVVSGKIVDISKTSSLLSLVPSQNKNTSFQIKVDSKTEYYSAQNQKIKSSDIVTGHRVIAILRPDEKVSKTYNALRLIDLDYSPTPTPTKK